MDGSHVPGGGVCAPRRKGKRSSHLGAATHLGERDYCFEDLYKGEGGVIFEIILLHILHQSSMSKFSHFLDSTLI